MVYRVTPGASWKQATGLSTPSKENKIILSYREACKIMQSNPLFEGIFYGLTDLMVFKNWLRIQATADPRCEYEFLTAPTSLRFRTAI